MRKLKKLHFKKNYFLFRKTASKELKTNGILKFPKKKSRHYSILLKTNNYTLD